MKTFGPSITQTPYIQTPGQKKNFAKFIKLLTGQSKEDVFSRLTKLVSPKIIKKPEIN